MTLTAGRRQRQAGELERVVHSGAMRSDDPRRQPREALLVGKAAATPKVELHLLVNRAARIPAHQFTAE